MRIKVKGINLLPKEYIIAEQISFYQKIGLLVLALWTVVFVVFIALPPKQEVARTRDILLAKQQEVTSSRYAGVNKTLSELEQAKTDMEALINNYKKIKKESSISGELLDTLISRVPSGITITSMDITVPEATGAKQVNISYNADTYSIGHNYIAILEVLFPTGEATIQSNYDKEFGKYRYTFSVNVPGETVSTLAAEVPATEAPAPDTTVPSAEGGTN